jgi:hypothetical protein
VPELVLELGELLADVDEDDPESGGTVGVVALTESDLEPEGVDVELAILERAPEVDQVDVGVGSATELRHAYPPLLKARDVGIDQ